MNQSILVNDLIAIPNLQLFVIESKIIIEINIWIKGDKQPSDLFSFLFFSVRLDCPLDANPKGTSKLTSGHSLTSA